MIALRARWAAWRAERAARSEFVRASQARIWRITSVSVLAILGCVAATLAVISNGSTLTRLSDDERCLRSVIAAQNDRSSVLSRLGKQRTDADNRRQSWNTAEQRAFAEALAARTPADRRKVRHDFTRALKHYLHADTQYRRLNTRYNQAQQAHPVPKLHCTAGRLHQPVPTVTATRTATATHTMPARTKTRTVQRPGGGVVRTRVIVRTVTAPPGKGRGRHHHGR